MYGTMHSYWCMPKKKETRMWANAQRDGRPAEHRWRPLFNAQSLADAHYYMPCSNAAKTRNPLKFAEGCLKLQVDLSR